MKSAYLLGVALMTASVSFADRRKLSDELRGFDPDATVDVIVQYRNVPASAHHEKLAGRDAKLKADLHSINAGAYAVRAGALELMADDPDVEFIAPDHSLSATTFNGGADWGRATVLGLNSSFASLPYDGAGIGVAILDSGVNAVDDLSNAQRKNSAIVFNKVLSPATRAHPMVTDTALTWLVFWRETARIPRANTFTYEIRGIAPGVHLVSLRVVDNSGRGTDSAVISAIQTAIQLNRSSRPGMPGSWSWSQPVTRAVITRREPPGTRLSQLLAIAPM